MNKIVSATEFKAKCLRLIDEVNETGLPIAITRHGKVVAELSPKRETSKLPLKSLFGMLKSDRYRFDIEPEEPAYDGLWDVKEGEWEPKP